MEGVWTDLYHDACASPFAQITELDQRRLLKSARTVPSYQVGSKPTDRRSDLYSPWQKVGVILRVDTFFWPHWKDATKVARRRLGTATTLCEPSMSLDLNYKRDYTVQQFVHSASSSALDCTSSLSKWRFWEVCSVIPLFSTPTSERLTGRSARYMIGLYPKLLIMPG